MEYQGQPLQNLLSFISIHYPQSNKFLSYRRSSQSTILTLGPVPTQPNDLKLLARWEKDFSGKRVPKRQNLSSMMDPKKRIAEARDLNNNLMKWRVATGLDLLVIKKSKVLVLGMGTLGCGVVRTLMVPPTSLNFTSPWVTCVC
jgi:hypothetical protein